MAEHAPLPENTDSSDGRVDRGEAPVVPTYGRVADAPAPETADGVALRPVLRRVQQRLDEVLGGHRDADSEEVLSQEEGASTPASVDRGDTGHDDASSVTTPGARDDLGSLGADQAAPSVVPGSDDERTTADKGREARARLSTRQRRVAAPRAATRARGRGRGSRARRVRRWLLVGVVAATMFAAVTLLVR